MADRNQTCQRGKDGKRKHKMSWKEDGRNKYMTETIKEILIVLPLLFLLACTFLLGRITAPETWVYPHMASSTIMSTHTIFIAEEYERCKELRGVFFANVGFPQFFVNALNQMESNYGTMSCTKTYTEGNKEITETLFTYTFEE